MKVLVTGATGLVGRAIAAHLARSGREVRALSRRPSGHPGLHGRFDANLADPGVAARARDRLDRCDAIVHAAADLSAERGRAQALLVNCLGTQQMVELAQRWDAAFVFVSSVGVIGRPRRLPVTEDDRARPASGYHADKLHGEHLTEVAAASGLAACALRLSSPVGPGLPADRVFRVFVARALAGEAIEVAGSGERRQDYLDVRDLARGVAAALERRPAGPINLAAGASVSNAELARRCVELLGSSAPVRLGCGEDPQEGIHWDVSIERAAKLLAWAPRHTLEDKIELVAGDVRAGAISERAPAG